MLGAACTKERGIISSKLLCGLAFHFLSLSCSMLATGFFSFDRVSIART